MFIRLVKQVTGSRREQRDKPVVERNRVAVQREPPDPARKRSHIQGRMPKVCEKHSADQRSRGDCARLSHTFGMRALGGGFMVRVIRWFSLGQPRCTTG